MAFDKRMKFNLTGMRFDRLFVVRHHKERHKPLYWVCRCDCGKEIMALSNNLRDGRTRSCGCLGSEVTAKRNRANATHRKQPAAVYASWKAMRERCLNESHEFYTRYGGRGIRICERWSSFESFRDDMGPRPRGTSLERIDNDKGYEPDNCRWADQKEQCRNRVCNVYFTVGEKTQCMSAWAEEYGIPYITVQRRVARGWPMEQIIQGTDRSREIAFRSGARLAQWMRENGYTDRTFAEKVGVNPNLIARYRTGVRMPNRYTFQRIQEVTGGAITRADFYKAA